MLSGLSWNMLWDYKSVLRKMEQLKGVPKGQG